MVFASLSRPRGQRVSVYLDLSVPSACTSARANDHESCASSYGKYHSKPVRRYMSLMLLIKEFVMTRRSSMGTKFLVYGRGILPGNRKHCRHPHGTMQFFIQRQCKHSTSASSLHASHPKAHFAIAGGIRSRSQKSETGPMRPCGTEDAASVNQQQFTGGWVQV